MLSTTALLLCLASIAVARPNGLRGYDAPCPMGSMYNMKLGKCVNLMRRDLVIGNSTASSGSTCDLGTHFDAKSMACIPYVLGDKPYCWPGYSYAPNNTCTADPVPGIDIVAAGCGIACDQADAQGNIFTGYLISNDGHACVCYLPSVYGQDGNCNLCPDGEMPDANGLSYATACTAITPDAPSYPIVYDCADLVYDNSTSNYTYVYIPTSTVTANLTTFTDYQTGTIVINGGTVTVTPTRVVVGGSAGKTGAAAGKVGSGTVSSTTMPLTPTATLFVTATATGTATGSAASGTATGAGTGTGTGTGGTGTGSGNVNANGNSAYNPYGYSPNVYGYPAGFTNPYGYSPAGGNNGGGNVNYQPYYQSPQQQEQPNYNQNSNGGNSNNNNGNHNSNNNGGGSNNNGYNSNNGGGGGGGNYYYNNGGGGSNGGGSNNNNGGNYYNNNNGGGGGNSGGGGGGNGGGLGNYNGGGGNNNNNNNNNGDRATIYISTTTETVTSTKLLGVSTVTATFYVMVVSSADPSATPSPSSSGVAVSQITATAAITAAPATVAKSAGERRAVKSGVGAVAVLVGFLFV